MGWPSICARSSGTILRLAKTDHEEPVAPRVRGREVDVVTVGTSTGMHSASTASKVTVPGRFEAEYGRVRERIQGLRRCVRCVLPETAPFIEFDEHGVWSFRHLQRPITRGAMRFSRRLPRTCCSEPDRRPLDQRRARQLLWVTHYVVKELGMKPIAYTYDWGHGYGSGAAKIPHVQPARVDTS